MPILRYDLNGEILELSFCPDDTFRQLAPGLSVTDAGVTDTNMQGWLSRFREGDIQPVPLQGLAAELSRSLLNHGILERIAGGAGDPTGSMARLIFAVEDRAADRLEHLPLELFSGPHGPFALRKMSLVRLVRQHPPVVNFKPPLRVLLVRAQPTDLDPIPPACLLAEQIRGLVSPGQLTVDVLSTEGGGQPGPLGPPTWDRFRKQFREADYGYHVIVFLGHGDVFNKGAEDHLPGGVLLFERPHDAKGRAYSQYGTLEQLRSLFHGRQVPVVLLVGCLTGAGLTEATREQLPRWVRGSRVMARRLAEGCDGVACVVGMQQRLRGAHAEEFLRAFFQSLLVDRPGHVEAAVHAGRVELFENNQDSAAWAAPILFSKLPPEPVFPLAAGQMSGGGRAAPAAVTPYDAAWLIVRPTPEPLFNRQRFREDVRRLLAPGRPQIMVVHGPRFSGKSHSQHFFSYLEQCGQIGSSLLRHIPREREEVRDWTPERLLRHIATDLALPGLAGMPRAAPEEGTYWIAEMVRWFGQQASRLPAVLLLNGFDEPGLPMELHQLVNELAGVIDRDLPEFRLVLLGYDQPLTSVTTGDRLIRERVDLDTYPTVADLEDYIGRLIRQLRLSPAPKKEYVQRVARQMYRPPGRPDRLKTIREEVVTFTRGVLISGGNGEEV